MNLEAIRAELPVLDTVAYLNTGTFGPLPRRTVAAMVAQQESELASGRSGTPYWERIQDLRRRAREGLGSLIGAPPEAVALTRSTSEGCAIAVASLGLGPGDEIVTTDAEHFGLLGPVHTSGATVVVARVEGQPTEDAATAIEAAVTPRTRLLAVSHVTWTTGALMPLLELADHLGSERLPILVDGAQGAGAVAVDVSRLGCDFYTVSGQKWLLGPDATGALYVRPERIDDLRVTMPSYFGRERHDETGAFVPVAGAQRFDSGSFPAPALAGLLESLAFADAAGPERLGRALAQTARACELLSEVSEVLTEPGRATLASFRVAGADPAEAVAALAERGVVVRSFPGLDWLRASVGFWTSDEDLDRLVVAVRALGTGP